MIGPVSGTGRAMMASLQQAMSKGMPPDQAIQYVKSMATQGIAPLADLYAMMNQFQRLKQQPVKPPQTPPTIRDELNMAEQMQAQGGMPPQMMGGAPQMPGGGVGGPQMPPPMAQGLGSMNAGAMENPSFAGGGIVAFQEGGGPTDSESLEAEVERILKKSPVFRTPEENEILRAAGMKLERRTIPKEGLTLPGADVIKRVIDPSGITGFTGQIYTPPAPAAAPEVAATQSAMPGMSADNPYANPAAAGSAFDLMAANARAGVRQEDTAPPRREVSMPSMSGFQRMELPVAKSREQFYEELKATQQKEGIGEAARKREEYLTNEEARLKKEYGSDKMLAFAEAGFRMAGAASRPGATFLGALSEGAMSGTQALRALNKEQRASRRAMDEARFQLAEAAEQRKLGNMKDATILAEKAKDRFDQAQRYNMELENDIQKLRITTGTQLEAAKISAGERAESRALAREELDMRRTDKQIEVLLKQREQASMIPDEKQRVAALQALDAEINRLQRSMGGGFEAMPSQSAIPDAVLQALNKYR